MSSLNENFKIKNGLTVNTTVSAGSCVEADSFKKHGGTSSQFLKADGSVDTASYTTCTGDITEVVAGTNLTGGGVSGSVTVNMDTGGIGAGTYGDTNNGQKDTITVDAYGRVTAVACGPTGDIQGICTNSGSLLSGVIGTGTACIGIDSGALTPFDQSACPGIDCVGDVTGITTGPYLTGGGASGCLEVGIDSACAAAWNNAASGGVQSLSAGDGLLDNGTSSDPNIAVDCTVVRTSGNQTIADNKTFTFYSLC